MPELFTRNAVLRNEMGAAENAHLLKVQGSFKKLLASKGPGHRERKRSKRTNIWKQRDVAPPSTEGSWTILEGWEEDFIPQFQPPPFSTSYSAIQIWSGWCGGILESDRKWPGGGKGLRGMSLWFLQLYLRDSGQKDKWLLQRGLFFFFKWGVCALAWTLYLLHTKTLGARRMGGPWEENRLYLKCPQPLDGSLQAAGFCPVSVSLCSGLSGDVSQIPVIYHLHGFCSIWVPSEFLQEPIKKKILLFMF